MTAERRPKTASVVGRAFGQSDPAAVDSLMALAESRTMDDGVRLCQYGEHADRVYVIEEGYVDLTLPVPGLSEDRGVLIERADGGAVLGWSALTEPFRYALSAWSVGTTSLLVIDGQALSDWCDRQPEFGLALHREIARVIGHRLESISRALVGEIAHGVQAKRRGAYT